MKLQIGPKHFAMGREYVSLLIGFYGHRMIIIRKTLSYIKESPQFLWSMIPQAVSIPITMALD